jgi:hypothetical protein
VTHPGGSGPDLIGDFQRWLLRSSARGVGKQVTGQLRSAFGRNQPTGDVWESATADPTPEEAPECAWCPVCRAARVIRASRPGIDVRVPPVTDARVRAVSDALGTVVQDAFNVLEAALAATGRQTSGGDGRRPGAATQAAGAERFPAAGRATATTAAAGPASASAEAAGPASATPGTAGQGPGDEPSGPPGGSPREPDDRG